MGQQSTRTNNGVRRATRASLLAENGRALRWRCVGPHRGGRVVAVAGDESDPAVFYFGACAGGVWKTADGGTYWENVSDGHFDTAAVGALAVAPSDPSVIYVGTGEATIRGNVSHGDGVYRSNDGGRSWKLLGLADTRHIAKVRVHPANPDCVYVAALGHAWGSNRERGVFRSRDGGSSWEQVLYRDEHTGAADLSIDPTNPRVLYASMWQARRTPYSLSSGGPGCSIYRSSDGGDSWSELTDRPGLPAGVKGKIGLAVSPARPGRVWALIEAKDGALFRSDDGGDTWQRLSEDAELRKRAWYYTHVYADPLDPDTVWVLNLQCWKSTDGGRNFTAVPTPHGDNHDLWIDPRDSNRMIEGNDGGACVSYNGGRSWSTLYNQPTAQMYHVTTDTRHPYRIYGSQQDNSAICLPSMSTRGAVTQEDWYVPGGGESGYIAVRPDDPDIVYGGGIGSGAFNGRLLRYDHRTRQQRDITVWPDDQGMGDGADSLKYRFQWTFPIELSPHDPNVLYVAANKLLRSRDEGASWEEISPDLTRNDPDTLRASGGPITRDNTGAEVYATIFAFVESPHQSGLFWTGSDDGLVHLSRDNGATWHNVTPPDLADWALITTIEVSPHDPRTAYVCATRYKFDDTRPYLYKTADFGETWRPIVAGIPEHEFTRVLRADPVCPGLLFVGTETGIHVSFDDGESWDRLAGNLPVVPIYDLAIKNDDLVAATHGRSFWILDDLTPLRQLGDRDRLNGPHLFEPRPAERIKLYQGWGYKPSEGVNYRHVDALVASYCNATKPDGTPDEQWLDAGKNPPVGVTVTYYLREEPVAPISLAFCTQAGVEIRSFSSAKPAAADAGDDGAPSGTDVVAGGGEGMEEVSEVPPDEAPEPTVPAAPGLNRFVWDMRYPNARKVPGDKSVESMPGPVALPGTYEVRLSVAGQTLRASVEIVKDRASNASDDELRAQFDLALNVRDKLSQIHGAVICVRDLLRQLDAWITSVEKLVHGSQLVVQARALKARLRAIEDELIQREADSPLNPPSRPNFKLASLLDSIQSADAAPTRGQYGVFEELGARVDATLEQLRDVVDRELSSFNDAVHESRVPAIIAAV